MSRVLAGSLSVPDPQGATYPTWSIRMYAQGAAFEASWNRRVTAEVNGAIVPWEQWDDLIVGDAQITAVTPTGSATFRIEINLTMLRREWVVMKLKQACKST